MYYYEFNIESKRPDPIVSYDTLLYPFDNYIWGFTLAGTVATFIVLVMFQLAWSVASGETNPRGWLFQGIPHHNHRPLKNATAYMYLFADFSLAVVVMIDEALPDAWFYRRGFKNARMFLLFIWLFVGNVLDMGYRTVLIH